MDIIKSKILSSYKDVIYGISTKSGGAPPLYNNLSKHVGDSSENIRQNRDKFFGSLRISQARLVHGNQVHSNNVRIVSKPGLYNATDGIITSQENLFLVISTADCLPVMIYDARNCIIANIHAGWRGTQKKITRRAMEILINECGSKPEDIRVFLGPCISQKHFEVGEEVAETFESKYCEKRNGKYFVDILSDNLTQLKSLGIKNENIESCGLCTYENTDYLHSYRRDKEKSGRMFAIIGLIHP